MPISLSGTRLVISPDTPIQDENTSLVIDFGGSDVRMQWEDQQGRLVGEQWCGTNALLLMASGSQADGTGRDVAIRGAKGRAAKIQDFNGADKVAVKNDATTGEGTVDIDGV